MWRSITHLWDIRNPHMGCILRQSSAMKKTMKLEEILAQNLTRLMATTTGVDTIDKVSAKSGVGRGTVDRVKKAEVSTKIETVEALASAFGVTPIDLLTSQDAIAKARTAEPLARPSAQMQWVSEDEAQLLSDFRTTDDEGRDTIKKIAAIVPKVLTPVLIRNQTE